jgi:hypothetical protein
LSFLQKDLDLLRTGPGSGAAVGHDRGAGLEACPGCRPVDLLDVGGEAGFVGGALDESGLDSGVLDTFLDVMDKE